MKNVSNPLLPNIDRRKFIAGMGAIGVLGTAPHVFAAESSPALQEKIRMVYIGGSKTVMENCQMLCKDCNRHKAEK